MSIGATTDQHPIHLTLKTLGVLLIFAASVGFAIGTFVTGVKQVSAEAAVILKGDPAFRESVRGPAGPPGRDLEPRTSGQLSTISEEIATVRSELSDLRSRPDQHSCGCDSTSGKDCRLEFRLDSVRFQTNGDNYAGYGPTENVSFLLLDSDSGLTLAEKEVAVGEIGKRLLFSVPRTDIRNEGVYLVASVRQLRAVEAQLLRAVDVEHARVGEPMRLEALDTIKSSSGRTLYEFQWRVEVKRVESQVR